MMNVMDDDNDDSSGGMKMKAASRSEWRMISNQS